VRVRKTKLPVLAAWLASVPEGICPGCKRKKPQARDGRDRPLDICRRAACRGKWMLMYQRDRLPRARATVERVEPIPKTRSGIRLVLHLSCGHKLRVPGIRKDEPKTKECPRCLKVRARVRAANAARILKKKTAKK